MNDNEYYTLFKKKGAIATKAKNEFIAMIPRIYHNKIYKNKGFGSIYECAAKIGSVSHRVVDEILRLDKKLEDKPKTKSKIAAVGLSKVKAVANTVTKETDAEWSQKVTKLTRSALETQVRDIKNSIPGDRIPNTTQEVVFDNEFENFSVKLDPKIILKLKQLKNKMPKGTNWNEVFEKLLPGEPKPQKNPKASNPKSRAVPAQKRREALNKSSGLCSAPGCNKPATEIHHKKPWSIFRSHKDLEALCKGHHELAHQSETAIDRKFRIYKMQAALF